MKRFSAIFLILCLLLCACGKVEETSAPSTEATTEPSTEATTEPTVEETTEATEPEPAFRHPLNGTPLDAPWTGRPTAVVINNLWQALPHHGVSNADIFYEIEVEGGITRCLALFSDVSGIEKIGPIRSARSFFSNVAVSYDAPLIHCGGSGSALNAQYDDSGNRIENWAHVDATTSESLYFFRDKVRYNYQGYAWEHTLFATGEKLQKALEDKEYNTTNKDGTDYGLRFHPTVELDGEDANTVKIAFKGNKTTAMTYNAETGLYDAAQYDSPYIDANTGEVMTFRNLLVLKAEQWYDGNGYRTFYDLIGSGEGLFACDGKIVPIKWEREALYGPFSYTLEDGTPITLGVGKTYVAITSPKGSTSYE